MGGQVQAASLVGGNGTRRSGEEAQDLAGELGDVAPRGLGCESTPGERQYGMRDSDRQGKDYVVVVLV